MYRVLPTKADARTTIRLAWKSGAASNGGVVMVKVAVVVMVQGRARWADRDSYVSDSNGIK